MISEDEMRQVIAMLVSDGCASLRGTDPRQWAASVNMATVHDAAGRPVMRDGSPVLLNPQPGEGIKAAQRMIDARVEFPRSRDVADAIQASRHGARVERQARIEAELARRPLEDPRGLADDVPRWLAWKRDLLDRIGRGVPRDRAEAEAAAEVGAELPGRGLPGPGDRARVARMVADAAAQLTPGPSRPGRDMPGKGSNRATAALTGAAGSPVGVGHV